MNIISPLRVLAAALTAALFLPPAHAQNATTVPVGVVKVEIQASSNGITQAISLISPALKRIADPSIGLSSGKIVSFTSNSVTVADANWQNGALVNDFTPYYLQIVSGNVTGLTLRITNNTSNVLTLDTEGINLASVGLAANDKIQILEGDTVGSLLGTGGTGIVGGNQTQFLANQTDKITLRDNGGSIRTIYWNTDFSQWRRVGSTANMATIRISPLQGIVYYRIGQTPLVLEFLGEVPMENALLPVPMSGTSLHASYFPKDLTLGDLNIQSLSEWRSTNKPGVTIATADKVGIKDLGGIMRSFYHDGTNWRRSGTSAPQNTAPIPVGSAISITRFGTSGSEFFNYAKPSY